MNDRAKDGGAVAVLTAVLAVVLFGIAALVVDLGIARDNRRQAQNTADAAALAAANALYATDAVFRNAPGDFDAAVAAAKDYAAKNYGTTEAEWASCVNSEPLDHVPSGTSCISFDRSPYPTQALVVVPVRRQATFFGGVFGYQGVSIGALAQAQLDPGGQRLCTFCVLGDNTHVIQNGDVNVTGGNAYFNGNITLGPNGFVNSSKGNVVGDDGTVFEDGGNTYVAGTINLPGNVQPAGPEEPQVGQPRVVDPLAAQVLPFATQSTLRPKSGLPCNTNPNGGPGIYGSATLRGTCELDPGLYVFTGTLDLAGGATLIANGATLYFTCGSGTSVVACREGDEGGEIDMTGTAQYEFTAPLRSTHPTVPEELYGYSLVFDRYNESTTRLVGTSQSFISGTVYGVSTTLSIGGTADGSTPSTGWFVIGSLTMNGSPTLNVQFDASKNVRPSEGARGLVR